MRKNCSSDGEKLLKFEAEGREFAKSLRYYSNSERSEQFLVTEWWLSSARYKLSQLKSHATPYESECSHWWKLCSPV